MGISVSSAQSQANSLRAQATAIRDLANSLHNEKGDLNVAWQASEMKYVNMAIERIVIELRDLGTEIDSIAGDVVSVAYEIKAEEDRAREEEERRAREAREAEERAKAASKAYGR
ncbi:hypothetical protein [Cohnella sp. GCM10027633]|uniref:hypothetical protein n=1 Tax=unclassified Cohnella TaxID=2636738 RepID=UPI00363F35FD